MIQVGNAPVSWGVYEADRPNPPFKTILDAIAQAGYAGTELGPYGYLPTDPKLLATELSKRNLKLGSSFVALPLEDSAKRSESVKKAVAVAKLLATQKVSELILADDEDPARAKIAGRIPKNGSKGFSAQDWKRAAQTLHEVARAIREDFGMRVVVHHHAGTFIETPEEIDRLLEQTDPQLVGLLLDTGHATYGGGDPIEILRKHQDRVRYVHLKDVKASELARVRSTDISMGEAWKRGVFCSLGEGVVDFPALFKELRAQSYQGWVIVEQDVVPDEHGKLDPDPTESAKKSRRFLKEKVGI